MVKTVGADCFIVHSFQFRIFEKIKRIMQTLLVEIKDQNGLRILKDLEQAKIIRLIDEPSKEETHQRLSKQLRGSISKETATDMLVELEQIRNEWQTRNI